MVYTKSAPRTLLYLLDGHLLIEVAGGFDGFGHPAGDARRRNRQAYESLNLKMASSGFVSADLMFSAILSMSFWPQNGSFWS